jgi:uncharacterized protein (TIGR02145 family)
MLSGLKSFSFLCTAILLLTWIAAFAQQKGSFTDSRENKTYKTAKIGTQTWMAENLNYAINGSKCYDNDDANCNKYGRLYDWATAMDLPSDCNSAFCQSRIGAKRRGICPSGFHIPTDAEWDALYLYADGANGRGTKLKSTSDWNVYNGLPSGTDAFGFAALPGGFGNSNGNFYAAGYRSFWWSSSETAASYAYGRGIHFHEKAYRDKYIKSDLFSIRCIKD